MTTTEQNLIRLLAEAFAAGAFTPDVLLTMRTSMDVQDCNTILAALFANEKRWEELKASVQHPRFVEMMQLQARDVWADYTAYPRASWLDEVAAGDTSRGYWDWVEYHLRCLYPRRAP